MRLRSRISPSLIRVFDSSERNAELFGDLDVGQTVEVGKFERLSLGVAQLGQRPTCSIAVERVDHGVRRAVGRARRSRRVAELAVAQRLLRTHAVDRTSMGDRHGPTTHPTASRVETGCLAPELDEDLLGDLLGLGGIADDPQHDAVDRGRQLVVELGERPLDRPSRSEPSTHPGQRSRRPHHRRTCGPCSEPVRRADQSSPIVVRHTTGQSTARAGRASTTSRASCSSPKTS